MHYKVTFEIFGEVWVLFWNLDGMWTLLNCMLWIGDWGILFLKSLKGLFFWSCSSLLALFLALFRTLLPCPYLSLCLSLPLSPPLSPLLVCLLPPSFPRSLPHYFNLFLPPSPSVPSPPSPSPPPPLLPPLSLSLSSHRLISSSFLCLFISIKVWALPPIYDMKYKKEDGKWGQGIDKALIRGDRSILPNTFISFPWKFTISFDLIPKIVNIPKCLSFDIHLHAHVHLPYRHLIKAKHDSYCTWMLIHSIYMNICIHYCQ